MKLRPAELARLPDDGPRAPHAVLLFGEDAAQIVHLREQLAQRWAGPDAEAEMRLDRLTGPQLRADPAALDGALRAQGFFPGPRVVVLTEATDGLAAAILDGAALAGPPARLVVTAAALTPRSALRRGFETGARLAAVACYRGPLDEGALRAALDAHGLGPVGPEVGRDLLRLSGELDRLSFDQLLGKIALWQHGASGPLDLDAIAACAPPGEAVQTDDLILAVLRRDAPALRTALARLGGDGVALAIALGRQARQLLEARVAMEEEGQGADTALQRAGLRLAPARRDAAASALRVWRRAEIEALLSAVIDVDATLRSAGQRAGPPGLALLERALLRFALRTGR